jgi:hypothetical protein
MKRAVVILALLMSTLTITATPTTESVADGLPRCCV